jgi:membrane protein
VNPFKKLLPAVRLCALRNLPKLALAELLTALISAFAFFIFIAPFNINQSIQLSFQTVAPFFISLLLSLVISYLLQYGCFVLADLLYTGRYAVIGHLFTGFRDFKRGVRTALFFMLTYIFALFSASALGWAASTFFPGSFRLNMLLAVTIICVFLTLAVLYVRWGFVWFFLYDDPSLPVRQALQKSALVTKKKRIAFVLFCLQSGGLYLLCAALVLIFLLAQSLFDFSAISSPLDAFLRMLYMLCLYMALIRLRIAFAAVYEAEREKDAASLPENT